MDVGNPSNFARMNNMFHSELSEMKNLISGYAFTDEETRAAMKKVYKEYNYVMDPHGAVGYLGLQSWINESKSDVNGIFLETAHPAKFLDVVESTLEIKVNIPENLQLCMAKEKRSVKMSRHYKEFKAYLMNV
jgi:threonine synthase